MTKAPEMQALAARVLDLWQEQLTLIAQDPEYMRLMQSNLTAWGNLFGYDASAAKPDGAAPAATSSDGGDERLGQLADRLEQLDQRLQQLERDRAASKSSGKGGKSKRGSAKRPPAKRG